MIVYRGQRTRFEARFSGTPQTGYPRFEVRDPNNRLIATGTGSRDAAIDDLYYAQVQLPADALVGDQWVIIWRWKDVDGKESEYKEQFEVVDIYLAESDTRAQASIALAGRNFRTFIRFLDEPQGPLRLHLLDPDTDQPTAGAPSGGYAYPGDLRKVVDQGTVLYFWEGNIGTIGSYVLLWEYYPTPSVGPYYQYEMLYVIPLSFVPRFTELRVLIDKYQKKFGSRRAYEDAELLEYLMRGLDLVNQHHPLTDWTPFTIPKSLETYWIMYSAWYALNAQFLLEADAAFNYSGLSVTLDVDRTGYIESELERLRSYLDEKLTQTKIAILRRQYSGLVAGRGLRPIPQFRYVGTWRRPRLITLNY